MSKSVFVDMPSYDVLIEQICNKVNDKNWIAPDMQTDASILYPSDTSAPANHIYYKRQMGETIVNANSKIEKHGQIAFCMKSHSRY